MPGIEALWRTYRESHSADARNELLFTFCPMVDYFVARAGSELLSVELEEFTGAGIAALLVAFESHDPSGGETLQQCAWRHVGQAMSEQAVLQVRRRARQEHERRSVA